METLHNVRVRRLEPRLGRRGIVGGILKSVTMGINTVHRGTAKSLFSMVCSSLTVVSLVAFPTLLGTFFLLSLDVAFRNSKYGYPGAGSFFTWTYRHLLRARRILASRASREVPILYND